MSISFLRIKAWILLTLLSFPLSGAEQESATVQKPAGKILSAVLSDSWILMEELELKILFRSVLEALQVREDLEVERRSISLATFRFITPGSTTLRLIQKESEAQDFALPYQPSPYDAPEVLLQEIRKTNSDFDTQGVDIGEGDPRKAEAWAAGVILYHLLFNKDPFPAKTDDIEITYNTLFDYPYGELLRIGLRHKSERFLAENIEPPFIHPNAHELLESLLKKNPENRFTIEQALENPWLQIPIYESDSDAIPRRKIHVEGLGEREIFVSPEMTISEFRDTIMLTFGIRKSRQKVTIGIGCIEEVLSYVCRRNQKMKLYLKNYSHSPFKVTFFTGY